MLIDKIVRKYSWIPDLPDGRDLLGLSEKLLMLAKPLPDKVDLRKGCSAIQDQLSLGSCTAQAIVSVLEFLDNKDGKYIDLSRLFLYYNERLAEGNVDSDSGAMIRTGIKSVNKIGVCDEKLWVYDIVKFKEPPATRCFSDAVLHRSVEYRRLSTIHEIKSVLAAGFPVVFGMSVYESFEYSKTAKSGIVPMPTKDESMLGGHCVYTAGYDNDKKDLICMNSWGKDWGDAGSFYLPYEYLLNGLADDFWMISKINYND
jgi:C1A family cysteine protease